jgi:uncharacterized oxidoreductase
MSSRGKVVLTGGTSGIGAELLRILLRESHEVVVLARRAADIPPRPGMHPIVCDLADSEGLPVLVAEVLRQHPDISILINNAALQVTRPLTDPELHPASIIEEAAINLVAPALLAQAVLPSMMSRGDGMIINISSGLAVFPKERTALYCATKAGLSSLSRSLRWQVEGKGVTVTEVILPLVDTPMTAGRGGSKLAARDVAETILEGMRKRQETIRIGKARLLPLLSRLAPSIGNRMMRHG